MTLRPQSTGVANESRIDTEGWTGDEDNHHLRTQITTEQTRGSAHQCRRTEHGRGPSSTARSTPSGARGTQLSGTDLSVRTAGRSTAKAALQHVTCARIRARGMQPCSTDLLYGSEHGHGSCPVGPTISIGCTVQHGHDAICTGRGRPRRPVHLATCTAQVRSLRPVALSYLH